MQAEPCEPAGLLRLETERLSLRPYQPGDGPWFYAMSQRNQVHLLPFEAGNVAMGIGSVAEAEATVQALADEWSNGRSYFLAAFDRASGRFVAQVYIGVGQRDLPEFHLGYFADCEHEGQGYVTEASRAALGFIFDTLGGLRVHLECDEHNLRSQHVAQRLGFTLEGCFREDHRWPDGHISSTMHYGLLLREFQAAGK